MANDKSAARPLSPHLQIYRPMLTMMMSIMQPHYGDWSLFRDYPAGVVADCRVNFEGYFDFVQGFFGRWFGKLLLVGFTWALIHHALGGASAFAVGYGAGL